MRRISSIAVVMVLVSCGMAHAGPVLLASFDFTRNAGVAPLSDPRFELMLQLPSDLQTGDFGLGTGLNVLWGEGDAGMFDYTATNDDTFADFALHATDGIEDQFTFWIRFPSGQGEGKPGTEIELFSGSPDLIGNDLELVRLIIRDVAVQPLTVQPHPDFPVQEGFTFDVEGTYEFYGTPIPEPATLIQLSLLTLAFLWTRHSRGPRKEMEAR